MRYKQYTICTPSSSFFAKNQYISIAIQSLAMGFLALVSPVLAGRMDCWPIVAEMTVFMGTIAYCQWWMMDRLLCLGGDRTAIGMLVSVEGPFGKAFPGNWDTDYSINLLLPDNPLGADKARVQASTPYGHLVSSQPPVTDNGFTLEGYQATDVASGIKGEVLHAEFEGAGVYDFHLGALIAFGLATLALGSCLFVPFPIGHLIMLILAILAFLAWLLGALIGNFDGASPEDANPYLGELHTNITSPDGTSKGAHILVVYGTWVFDTAHEGWNEIHPIKLCERIGIWDGHWPKDIKDIEKMWEDAIAKATAPGTIEEQKKPENQWAVHPVIDGCGDGG